MASRSSVVAPISGCQQTNAE